MEIGKAISAVNEQYQKSSAKSAAAVSENTVERDKNIAAAENMGNVTGNITGSIAEQTSGLTVDGASLTISEEGFAQEQTLLEQLREQAGSGDAAADAFEDQAKIMEIARRISKGDRVPSTDEKKLMEYSPELYQMAKQAAVLNEGKKHKEYESLFEDEEEGVSQDKLEALEDDGAEEAAAADGETLADS